MPDISVRSWMRTLSSPSAQRASDRQSMTTGSNGRARSADPAPIPTYPPDTGVSMSTSRILGTALALSLGAQFTPTARAADPPQPVVTPLMLKDLTELPGREMLMISVVYPPGAVEH